MLHTARKILRVAPIRASFAPRRSEETDVAQLDRANGLHFVRAKLHALLTDLEEPTQQHKMRFEAIVGDVDDLVVIALDEDLSQTHLCFITLTSDFVFTWIAIFHSVVLYCVHRRLPAASTNWWARRFIQSSFWMLFATIYI